MNNYELPREHAERERITSEERQRADLARRKALLDASERDREMMRQLHEQIGVLEMKIGWRSRYSGSAQEFEQEWSSGRVSSGGETSAAEVNSDLRETYNKLGLGFTL